MLNFNHLYYFYVFVTEGGVSKAARKLSISQPALSAQLRQFENQMGEKLMVRAGRHLEITERGKLVYGYARQMFALGDELRDAFGDKADRARTAALAVGAARELPHGLVIDVLGPVLDAQPDDKTPALTLVGESHDELIDQLRSRRLDLVFSNQPDYQDDMHIVAEVRLPVAVLASSALDGRYFKGKKQLFEKNILGTLKLFRIAFALPHAGSRLRGETERFFEDRKMTIQPMLESESMEALVRAVGGDLGVAFLPRAFAARAIERREVQAFGPADGFWRHSLWLLARRADSVRPLFREIGKALSRLGSE